MDLATIYTISYYIGLMIGGALAGLIPFIIALIKRKGKAGVRAILLCAVASLFGAKVSIGIMVISTLVIIFGKKAEKDNSERQNSRPIEKKTENEVTAEQGLTGTVNTWPGWEHVRELGAGSFGKVHEIRREDHGKTYRAALKVITIPSSQSEIREAYNEGMNEQNVTEYFREFVENITEEFALMSEFKGQSNIVSYEDHKVIKHEDGIGWDILIRMEMLTPLSDWGSNHPLNEADVIAMGCDICHALELCWQKRIIHRDIKPENIFVSEYGDYKLGDFGIARTSEKTRANLSQKGTYTYIAPEVYKGQEYGRTADIYSLGMVLYRYLNENRMPFMPLDGIIRYNDREEALKRRICGEQIPLPIRGSRALKEVVLKALAYAPEERYQFAGEFRKALEGCVKEIGDGSEGTMQLFPNPKKYTEDEDTSGRKTQIIRQERQEEPKPQEETKQQGVKKNKMLIISLAGIVGLVLLVCVIILVAKRPEPVPEPQDTTEVSTEPDSAEATPDDSGQSDKKYEIKVFNRSDMSQLYRGEFADSVYLGRSSENDIMFDDSTVSERHCRIINKNGRFFVEDLKSTSGTFVNGKKIDGEEEVFPNVKISIGMGSGKWLVLFEAVRTVPETPGENDTSDAGGDMPTAPVSEEDKAFMQKVYDLMAAGSYEAMQGVDGSEEAKAFVGRMGSDRYIYFPDNNAANSGKGAGVYKVGGSSYYFYYGDFENGIRKGTGTQFASYYVGYDVFVGRWVNDAPNGAGVLEEVYMPDDGPAYNKESRGILGNGLWDGNVNAVLTDVSKGGETFDLSFYANRGIPTQDRTERYYSDTLDPEPLENGKYIVAYDIDEDGNCWKFSVSKGETIGIFGFSDTQ